MVVNRLTRRGFYNIAVTLTLLQLHPTLVSSSTPAPRERCSTIDAAFTTAHGEGTFFLSGGEYIKYSTYRQSEAKVGPITELGLDERVNHSAAAFTLADGSVVIIKGCRYFKYTYIFQDGGHLTFELIEEGLNFGDLPCYPDAALTWRQDILVFKGCDVWRFSNKTGSFTLDGGWVDTRLPCDLDAAAQWDLNQAIFIKGTRFWTFDGELKGPFHTDTLHLCSWYLCGEADWMADPNPGPLDCNGDRRLCHLRLNQVTMPGLHNAGSGFHGGFSFADCLVRNHARSILQQLRLGIRYLDIDSSYSTCGVLGTNHKVFCGGSVCRLLKEVRMFLSEAPHEVVTLTFNHDMQDAEVVIPALTRQLQSQLGPMLNDDFRASGEERWPKLHTAVRTNKRVFVFYTPAVHDTASARRLYTLNRWIHTERWVASTWTPTANHDGNCSKLVDLTVDRCRELQGRQLLEMSLILWDLTLCIRDLADRCRGRGILRSALRGCEPYRYRHNSSPNFLIVDYPEVDPHSADSVFQAVLHQNFRNIYTHRRGDCKVVVDAAVRKLGTPDQSLFFVGSKVITYSHSKEAQIKIEEVPWITSVDAAYVTEEGEIVVTKGCYSLCLDSVSLLPVDNHWSEIEQCETGFDAAVVWNGTLNVFRGCYVIPQGQAPVMLSLLGLPCDVDAALNFDGETFIFRGNSFWIGKYGEEEFVYGGQTLDWAIDAVVC